MKTDRWSGEKILRDRPLIGVIPPLAKPPTPCLVERRFISEQVIGQREADSQLGGAPCPLVVKGAIFENKIRAERPGRSFDVVEPLRGEVVAPPPPTTPKPPRRNARPEPKKLLSQRVIFLNDHNNNSKFRGVDVKRRVTVVWHRS